MYRTFHEALGIQPMLLVLLLFSVFTPTSSAVVPREVLMYEFIICDISQRTQEYHITKNLPWTFQN
jgi:hypothetical protein